MTTLLLPPLAFLLYLLAGAVIAGLGRVLAGPGRTSAMMRATYASGETAPLTAAPQGYSSGFTTALFFGVLHLGVLVFATSTLTAESALFLLGLGVALLVLWLE